MPNKAGSLDSNMQKKPNKLAIMKFVPNASVDIPSRAQKSLKSDIARLKKQQQNGSRRSAGSFGSHTSSKRLSAMIKRNLPPYVIKRRLRYRDYSLSRYVEWLPKDDKKELKQTAKLLMKPGLGILAVDDSQRQLGNRLKALNMENTETNRRRYLEMLLAGNSDTAYMDDYFSGVLMREESITQLLYRGKRLVTIVKERNVMLGVRFDKKVEPLGCLYKEYNTPGLDNVLDVMKRVKDKGAKFGLWRCVYRISEHTPSVVALTENSRTLTRFASLCQQNGLVPILAPEILADSDHGYDQAQKALGMILTTLVKFLIDHHVYLEGTLLRVTPAAPGHCYNGSRDDVLTASITTKILNQCLPPAIGGVLLPREETLCQSVSLLQQFQKTPIRKPFFISFCYSLVIQEGVGHIWAGQEKNLYKARTQLFRRAKVCCLAAMGEYHKGEKGDFLMTYSADC